MRTSSKVSVFPLLGLLVCALALGAQSSKQNATKGPSAPAPASPHDLSGVWTMHAPASARSYILDTFTKDEPAMTAWGEEQYKATKPSNGPRTHTLDTTDDPVLRSCLPPGVPRIYLQPFPLQIVQIPNEVIIVYEYDHTVRHIYTDLQKHPDDLTPTYMGHSIGHWEGDELVVDTTGFNDSTWLDRTGHRHSDQLHVVERLQRTDRDTLQVDISMDDSKALAKPWVSQLIFQLKPDWKIMEQNCADNGSFANFEK
jgi:hypothetical protein